MKDKGPEHSEARREWPTNDSQKMTADLREIAPTHGTGGPVMRASMWISRGACFAAIQVRWADCHIRWVMRPSPPFFRGWGWSVAPPPSYQALRNATEPFDAYRTPHPRTIAELVDSESLTAVDPYCHPPVLDIAPYYQIRRDHTDPPTREADVADGNGVCFAG